MLIVFLTLPRNGVCTVQEEKEKEEEKKTFISRFLERSQQNGNSVLFNSSRGHYPQKLIRGLE